MEFGEIKTEFKVHGIRSKEISIQLLVMKTLLTVIEMELEEMQTLSLEIEMELKVHIMESLAIRTGLVVTKTMFKEI